MKIKSEFKWHILLLIFIIATLFPIIFAVSNSFKELNEAYINVFSIIPKNPT